MSTLKCECGNCRTCRNREWHRARYGPGKAKCPQCGGLFSGTGQHCRDCAHEPLRKFNKQGAIKAIQGWVERHGRVPTIAEADSDERLPSNIICRRLFGNLGNAIEAAGFTRRGPGVNISRDSRGYRHLRNRQMVSGGRNANLLQRWAPDAGVEHIKGRG